MKIKAVIYSLFTILIWSCNSSNKNEAAVDTSKTLSGWIQGKYIFMDEGAGIYYEEWVKLDSSNYKGSGFYLTNDLIDTLFSMKMKMLIQKNKTTMIYDVKESGEKKELEFVLTSKENSTYVFENPFHDFPSIMQYKFLPDSTIEVTERGFVDNKEKVRDYKIKRIN